MRIGFDAKRAFTNNTGLGNYSRDTIRILSKSFKEEDFYLYTPKESDNQRLNFIKDRLNIHIRTPKNIFNRLLSSYWRTKNILKDLIEDKIDIYHGLSHEIPIGIEQTNIRSVVTIHDLIYLRYPKLFSSIDRKIYDEKFRSACIRANNIIAVSEQTKQDIISFFKIPEEKIQVIYQGCSTIFQQEMDKQEIHKVNEKYNVSNNFLLYVGTIEERKNLLTLLQSLKQLPRHNLIIIGDGKKYKQECMQYIKENNLEQRTNILSGLTLHEMACMYQQAQILIYPSLFEGFGIPIIEALFSKTPVITSKGGCFHEAGGPDSIYIDPKSSEEIITAIKNIDKDKELREKMINNGHSYVQKFTDEKIATNLMKFYKSLI